MAKKLLVYRPFQNTLFVILNASEACLAVRRGSLWKLIKDSSLRFVQNDKFLKTCKCLVLTNIDSNAYEKNI